MRSSNSPIVVATIASAATMLACDLLWLGVVAKGTYDALLGPLKRPDPVVAAAALFYALYLSAVMSYAVVGARTPGHSALRGAGLGLVAYGTWDLTNWAVLANWPAALVPIDLTWGVALTSLTAWVGALVLRWRRGVA